MDLLLEKQLCSKYPKMFCNKNTPINETEMYWGFECGNGWYNIIENLCEAMTRAYQITINVDKKDAINYNINVYNTTDIDDKCYLNVVPPVAVVNTVKEKFGLLRFYYTLEFDPNLEKLEISGKYPTINIIKTRYDDYFKGMVHLAEVLSSVTCEETGKVGELHVSGGSKYGWYKTLNREYVKTNSQLIERGYVPVSEALGTLKL